MQQGNMAGLLETQSAHKPWLLLMLQSHPLIFYFFIAYAISWGLGFPIILLWHAPAMLLLSATFTTGPTISSFIMTAATEGRAGVGNLLRRYVRWRVGFIWYVIAMIGIPAMITFVSLLQPGGGATVLNGLQAYPLTYVLMFFIGGPFFEEPGWRGFALPRLQQRAGPLPGSILLGVLWGLWHFPLFLIPGYNGAGTGFIGISTALLAFIAATVLFSILFAWVSNNTRGSLLPLMLLHASINTASSFIPASRTLLIGLIVSYASFAVLVLLIILGTGGRLSYDRFVRQINAYKTDQVLSDSEV